MNAPAQESFGLFGILYTTRKSDTDPRDTLNVKGVIYEHDFASSYGTLDGRAGLQESIHRLALGPSVLRLSAAEVYYGFLESPFMKEMATRPKAWSSSYFGPISTVNADMSARLLDQILIMDQDGHDTLQKRVNGKQIGGDQIGGDHGFGFSIKSPTGTWISIYLMELLTTVKPTRMNQREWLKNTVVVQPALNALYSPDMLNTLEISSRASDMSVPSVNPTLHRQECIEAAHDLFSGL
jgi:hypothetical protein